MNMAFSDSRTFDTGDVTLALRPLAWSELCARLVAAQDMRRIQNRRADATGSAAGLPVGSFHGGAAQMLEHHDPHLHDPDRGKMQHLVNLTSSIYGKGNQGTDVDSRETPLIERPTRQADETCHD